MPLRVGRPHARSDGVAVRFAHGGTHGRTERGPEWVAHDHAYADPIRSPHGGAIRPTDPEPDGRAVAPTHGGTHHRSERNADPIPDGGPHGQTDAGAQSVADGTTRDVGAHAEPYRRRGDAGTDGYTSNQGTH